MPLYGHLRSRGVGVPVKTCKEPDCQAFCYDHQGWTVHLAQDADLVPSVLLRAVGLPLTYLQVRRCNTTHDWIVSLLCAGLFCAHDLYPWCSSIIHDTEEYAHCFCRPNIEQHVITRREQKRQEARNRAQSLMARMRAEAQQGHVHLLQAQNEQSERKQGSWQHQTSNSSQLTTEQPYASGTTDESGPLFASVAPGAPAEPMHGSNSKQAVPPTHDMNFHINDNGSGNGGDELASEKAFKCFVRAVHALQSLDLQGNTVPQVGRSVVVAKCLCALPCQA